MKQQNLSNRERVAAYRLEASKLMQAAQQLEARANLIQLAEDLHELNTKLSKLCPDYILKTFEEQLRQNEQDQDFLTQRGIASSPEMSGSM
jgi:hypothetical protein